MPLLLQYFWRQISNSSYKGSTLLREHIKLLAQAKIDQLNMTLRIESNILWLEIPIYYLKLMQMLYGQYQFTNVLSSITFTHLLLLPHLLPKVASLAVFHNQVESVGVLKSVF